ncbi:MCM2/3/5 family-domain-containing protein [Scenedesmus sp. NREL 46B-D3]|nr:MCM2/3/5 family-domain-containing protein [Scenedesmus sp. NREL 46B-D3]
MGDSGNTAVHATVSEQVMVSAANSKQEALFTVHKQRTAALPAAEQGPARITLRMMHHSPSELHIRQLKSNSIGKLATLRGTVTRMSHVRPLIVEMTFTCNKCGSSISAAMPDGRFTPPTRCSGDGCRGRAFTPDRTSARCIDWQKLRLQELLGADQQQQGKVPRSVEVELKQDLVGSCVVGDVVAVLGLVKVLATGDAKPSGPPGAKKQAPKQNLFLIYVDALSLVNNKRAAKSVQLQDQATADAAAGGQQTQQVLEQQLQLQRQLSASASAAPNMPDFTLKDLQFILTFTEAYEGDQLRQLVAALCPTIYGHELVKAGLLLSLFGGVRKHGSSNNRVAIRGDINLLLVGDPGLGKSQLLQAVSAAAPRGLYVCGNTCTTAGLTVSVVRDAATGDSMFEAGAVVLADRGVCCVDEFDKMPNEHQALLEAMEQQEVSVAKAGLVASLPARTSIVAAANPVGGHFDRGKTVQENLKLSPAMLSRFDVVFVLLDRPDELMDQALSEHIMALHSGLADRAAAARQRLLQHQQAQALSQAPSLSGLLEQPSQAASQQSFGAAASAGGAADDSKRLPLALRLKLPADGAAEGSLLPVQLLRKYIAYARQHVFPVLSDEAKEILQSFYLSLRASSCGGVSGGLPITARQLESLVRLAEARARSELRETVTAEDALDVIEIMREGMLDRAPLGGMPGGMPLMDFRKAPGSRGGKAGEAARFMAAVRAMGKQQGRDVFDTAELQALVQQLQLNTRDAGAFIGQLNEAGELLKKGPGQYRVTGITVTSSQQQPADSGTAGGSAAGGLPPAPRNRQQQQQQQGLKRLLNQQQYSQQYSHQQGIDEEEEGQGIRSAGQGGWGLSRASSGQQQQQQQQQGRGRLQQQQQHRGGAAQFYGTPMMGSAGSQGGVGDDGDDCTDDGGGDGGGGCGMPASAFW